MQVKLTKKYEDLIKKVRAKSSCKMSKDFVSKYKEVDESGNITLEVTYSLNYGDELEINDNHYASSSNLQEFVNKEYLEII